MSLISFSIPTEGQINKKMQEQRLHNFDFIDRGEIIQTRNQTLYKRSFQIINNNKIQHKEVVFLKKGLEWRFEKINEINNI